MKKRPLRERFAEKYSVDVDTGCWLWTSAVNTRGYGVIWVDARRRAVAAHRVSMEVHRGPVPDGAFVCHSCDVPSCVNPDHLWLGDHAANMADMDAKGRRKWLSGDEHHDAVLNEEAVKVMRWAVAIAGRSRAEVARLHGVSEGAVCSAVSGANWADVDYWPTHRYRGLAKKLNEQAVKVIRHFARAGRPLSDIASAYGIHYQTAYRVAAGLRWAHVDYPTTRDPVRHG